MTASRPPVVLTLLVWTVLEIIAAWQVRTLEGVPLLVQWTRSIVRPVTWTAQQIGVLVVDVGRGTTNLQGVIAENRRLRLEIERLAAQNLLLEEDLSAGREADQLLGENARFSHGVVLARCTYRDLAVGSMEVRTADSVHLPRDTPAVTAGGLVGRVVRSEGHRHWIQLITHGAAAAAVQSAETSVQGLVVGGGDERLTVAYVPRQAKIETGQVLFTSGGDGIFPPAIPAATIVRIRETDDPFLQIGATPTADFRGVRVVMLLPTWSTAGRSESR